MSSLLNAMSTDMKIFPYHNESNESFTYRLCYSALGQWCLNLGRNKAGSGVGTSKHNQSIVLNELLKRYVELFPFIYNRFFDELNQSNKNISVFIRRVYEETGYLLTDKNNYNRLANFGRSIRIGDETLFFGLSDEVQIMNGLGVFASPTSYEVTVKEFLIRDSLTCDEYFHTHFELFNFHKRDIQIKELEFFNPLINNVPSRSWGKNLEVNCSIARKLETGAFYKVIKSPNGIEFAEEVHRAQSPKITAYEYRRLYFAIKKYYGNPIEIRITSLDTEYSRIQLGGHLPNREYYFLLLLSWPERSVFDKVNFIIKNKLLETALIVLKNIGFEIKGEYTL